MAHHASRNFAKHARGVSIFEASKKFPSGGLVRSRHELDEGLREAWSSILFGIYRMRNARSTFSLFLKLLDSQQFRRTRRSLRGFSIFLVSSSYLPPDIFDSHTSTTLQFGAGLANIARSWRADRWIILCVFGQVCIHHLIFSI